MTNNLKTTDQGVFKAIKKLLTRKNVCGIIYSINTKCIDEESSAKGACREPSYGARR